MPHVTFIRHAESEFNANPVQDHALINCDITTNGMKQCKKLDLSFDLLIMTPLKRSQSTYIHSNIKAKKLDILSLFREYKQDVCDFLKDEKLIKETEEEIISRVRKAIDYLRSLKEKNIGVIGHSDFIWYFMKEITGNDEHEILKNCEYIVITI